jgi:hypothetical protein
MSERLRSPTLLFANGIPFLTRKIVHYRDQEFSRRAQIPAPVASDRIVHRRVRTQDDPDWLEDVQV